MQDLHNAIEAALAAVFEAVPEERQKLERIVLNTLA